VQKITFVLRKSNENATRAAVFDSNMHQVVCWLGLRLRQHRGSLQHSPDPLAVFRGSNSKKGKGRGGDRDEGGRERREGREGVCPRKKKKRILRL